MAASQQVSTIAPHLAHTALTHVVPHVVPISPSIPAVEPISQFELTALLSLRKRARQIAEQVETAEKSIRERLESGAQVEAGEHTAELKESFRRSVSWRDVTLRLAAKLYSPKRAEAYCESVLHNTKPTRTVSLVIS